MTSSEAIAPLIYTTYAAYVPVPYNVGQLLITKDLSCSPQEAYGIILEGGTTRVDPT
jgi:hypothetical protein